MRNIYVKLKQLLIGRKITKVAVLFHIFPDNFYANPWFEPIFLEEMTRMPLYESGDIQNINLIGWNDFRQNRIDKDLGESAIIAKLNVC